MKILIVLPRFPFPLEKGDKLRAYHHIIELSKHHEVYLFALSHEAVTPQQLDALRPYCKQIRVFRLNKLVCAWSVVKSFFSIRSLQLGYWNTHRSRRAYRQFERQVAPDVVYNQMVRTIPLVSKSACPKVMDFQDALSMNTERRMERSRGPVRRVLHFEFKMLRSLEYNAFSIFDALTIIADTDADAIPHRRNSDIVIVPNGVDTDYFTPIENSKLKIENLTSKSAFNSQFSILNSHYDLCFCGNMGYAPNVDAARFLVQEVMPLVWAHRPETTLLLAGVQPKASVRALACDRVCVSGPLPDIREAYAASTMLVAPMQIGSGLQNKLLEAMAMQVPCITTPIANAPLGGTPGEHLLVGDGPQQLADHILHLLANPEEAQDMARRGHDFVVSHFSWEATTQILENTLRQAVEEHNKTTRP